MKEKAKKVIEYSIDDLDALMDSIKRATSLNEKAIMARAKMNSGYISQTKSRAKADPNQGVPAKLIEKLNLVFKDDLKKPGSTQKGIEDIIKEVNERIIKLEAQATIMIVSLAQVLSNQTGRAIGNVSVELSKAIDEEMMRMSGKVSKK